MENENEAQLIAEAQPAIDDEGRVRLLILKVWPSIKVGAGSSQYTNGFSAVADGKLIVRFPATIKGNKELTAEEFSDLCEALVLSLKGSAKQFVKIVNYALTPDETDGGF